MARVCNWDATRCIPHLRLHTILSLLTLIASCSVKALFGVATSFHSGATWWEKLIFPVILTEMYYVINRITCLGLANTSTLSPFMSVALPHRTPRETFQQILELFSRWVAFQVNVALLCILTCLNRTVRGREGGAFRVGEKGGMECVREGWREEEWAEVWGTERVMGCMREGRRNEGRRNGPYQ